MTTTEINTAYPIRNQAWSFDAMTGRWVAEDSTLQGMGFSDPWKREFPVKPGRPMVDPSSEEIAGWVYKTTVAGNEVECLVIND